MSAQTSETPHPDASIILINGRIATQDGRRSFATAVAIKDGRFVTVGSDQEILAYRGATTQVIDLGGRTVIPGLNDSHLHLIRGGLNYNLELRWDGVPIAGRRLADAPGAGPAHAAAAVGPRRRRLDRVPVRRAAHADPGRDQRRLPRHAGLRPAPLRPGLAERGGAAGLRLHQGHARPARRRNPAGQAGQPDRPAHRPAQRDDPLRHAGQGAEVAPGPAGQLDPALHARDEPPRHHQRHRRRRRLPELPRRLPGHRGPAPAGRDDRPHRLQPVHPAAQAGDGRLLEVGQDDPARRGQRLLPHERGGRDAASSRRPTSRTSSNPGPTCPRRWSRS